MRRLTGILRNSRLRSIDYWLLAAIGLALTYGIFFSVLSLLRHYAFNSHSFDLGIMHQAVWNTFKGDWFFYTYTLGSNADLTNYLGNHVRPILALLSLLYFIYDGPETLLIVQSFVVGSAAIPLFLLGRRKLGHAAAALIFALVFTLHPAIQIGNLFDFHPSVMAGAFFIWAFYLAEEERYILMGIALLLAISSKENIALAVGLFGLYLIIRRKYRPGAIVLILGGLWFAVSLYVIQPSLNDGQGSIHLNNYAYLGDSPGDMVKNLFTKPSLTWNRLTEPLTQKYATSIFSPLGWLSFLSPQILFIGASEFAIGLFSDADNQRTICCHYPALLVSISAVAAVYGTGWLALQAKRRLGIDSNITVITLAFLALFLSLRFHISHYQALVPLSDFHARRYEITDHDRLAKRFLRQIPPEVKLSAQGDLAPHVSGRKWIYPFPTILDAEYILLDTTSTLFPVDRFPIDGLSTREAYEEYIRRAIQEEGFAIIDAEDGWLLLERGGKTNKTALLHLPPEIEEYATQPEDLTIRHVFAAEAEQAAIELVKVDVTPGSSNQLSQLDANSVWSSTAPISHDYDVCFDFADERGAQHRMHCAPISTEWPASKWQPGELLYTSHRFGVDPYLPSGIYTVTMSLVDNEDNDIGLPAVVHTLGHSTISRVFTPPSPAISSGAQWSDNVALDGYDLELTGNKLSLTLYWQALQRMSESYKYFVHLIDPKTGEIMAQIDSIPRQWTYPTDWWEINEYVADENVLDLEFIPATDYQLFVGLYHEKTGDRLPIFGVDANNVVNNALLLTTISVE